MVPSIRLPWHRNRRTGAPGTRGAQLLVLLTCLGPGLAGCGGGSVRACFGDDAFCDRVFARNQAPIASAGIDQTVTAGDLVTLDGSASRDPDGTITTYSWTQQEGPGVAIEDATRAVAGFHAPSVDAETRLRFRLVVTDDRDASDSDRVEITVLPVVASALRHGVSLLKAVQDSTTGHAELTCGGCAARLGLWLGARALAAEAGADAEIDALLDAVRVLTTLHSERLDRAPQTREMRTLFELGHAELAFFTVWRDPATAERARVLAGSTTPAGKDSWRAGILAADPGLAPWLDADPLALSRWLRGQAADASLTETAVAVILLAQATATP